jgi:hypothetical protein
LDGTTGGKEIDGDDEDPLAYGGTSSSPAKQNPDNSGISVSPVKILKRNL